MCVSRKTVIKVLIKYEFYLVTHSGVGSSHSKYSGVVEGKRVTCILSLRKDFNKDIIKQISKQTGIPEEEFFRFAGSKKHQNRNGHCFGFYYLNYDQ
jgi:predicted RNA binding protein YcfA (HicA-like mRNA interferase family)